MYIPEFGAVWRVKRPKKNYINNRQLYESMRDWRVATRLAEKEGREKPPIPDYVGAAIKLLCERMSTKINFVGYCVDDQTEALTKRGWTSGADLREDDVILSLDPSDGFLKWSSIKSIYRDESYDGPMHRLTHRNLDALVTPGHKFLTASGLKPVELLRVEDRMVLNGAPVMDVDTIHDDEFVELAAIVARSSWFTVRDGARGKTYSVNSVIPVISERRELVHEYLNEYYLGSPRRKGQWRSKPHFIVREYDETVEFVIKGELAEKLFHAVGQGHPSVDFVLEMNALQRHEFLVTYHRWNDADKIVAPTIISNESRVDSLTYLAALCGVTVVAYEVGDEMIKISHYPHQKTTCPGGGIDFNGGRPYRGRDGSGLNKEDRPNAPTEHYSGLVWCPETEYGTFVCRRNGKVYVTGNSFREEMVGDAILDCVQGSYSFDSDRFSNPFGYFSMIAWRAMIRKIYREKLETYVKHKSFLNGMIAGENYDSHPDWTDPRAQRTSTETSSSSGSSTGAVVGATTVSDGVVTDFEALLDRRKKKKDSRVVDSPRKETGLAAIVEEDDEDDPADEE